MQMLRPKILIPKEVLEPFCRKHHIVKLALFGSVLQDDFGPGSDLDLLVEFEPGHVPGFFALFDMEDELSFELGGRSVEIRTPEDISRYLRQAVLATAVVQYATG